MFRSLLDKRSIGSSPRRLLPSVAKVGSSVSIALPLPSVIHCLTEERRSANVYALPLGSVSLEEDLLVLLECDCYPSDAGQHHIGSALLPPSPGDRYALGIQRWERGSALPLLEVQGQLNKE